MNSGALQIMVVVLAFVLFCNAKTAAQTDDRIRGTWKGPDASLVMNILKDREKTKPLSGTAKSRLEVVKFNPVGESGVAKSLADAFGRTAEEKAALVVAFGQIKEGYEAEVAKAGKSNNLAAAMTFFITANVAAYHQIELPADEAGEQLFQSLQEAMAGVPAFSRLSNPEKQQMHDWLVCMAGFVLAGYTDARQNGDKESLKNFGELADYSTRLVLGVEVAKLRLTGNDLSAEGADRAPPAGPTQNKLVGAWSISASNHAGSDLITNAGYYKGQYQFKPDGTYSFKSERWFGYAHSKEFHTTDESGTYAITGDALTVIPKTSKTTLRNLEGVVQKAQNNQLERVTYKWQLHYFEGLNETQLILRPPRETARDGGFSSSGTFPNAYLYSPGGNLEWRF